MSNETFDNRMISTYRNIRQRCHLKYSRHGTFTWDKWTEYDCIFSSFIDSYDKQHNQLELHSKSNVHEPNGKVIDLKDLRSLTSIHGNTKKNEPKDIIILKIDGKKHRLGFDNIYEYNQWKTLLDGVYNSAWDMTTRNHSDENAAVNMLYESANATRYRVQFADLKTQELLSLPSGSCELVFDADKIVLEQYRDKQYTFPRSTIRTIRLNNDREIEIELGSRAPVTGFIRFRFDSAMEARSCYLQWNEGITTAVPTEITSHQYRSSVKHYVESTKKPDLPERDLLQPQHNGQPPRPPPRGISTRNPYYNTESASPSLSTNVPPNEYSAFHTLV